MATDPKKVFLYPSDIAAYIGQNQYDFVTPFERLWKRCDSESYTDIINNSKTQLDSQKKKVEDLEKQRENLQTELNNKKITKCQYKLHVKKIDKTVSEINKESKSLESKIDSIDLDQQQRLIKSIGKETVELLQSEVIETKDKQKNITTILDNMNLEGDKLALLQRETTSFINKTHGTLREDSAIEIYEQKSGITLDTSQKFYKRQIPCSLTNSSSEQFEWYIGGRLDGIYIDKDHPERSYIVEIKNRMRGFFSTLRDYEKTQIHLYMYLLNIPMAKLIEKYGSQIRTTVIYQDNSYLENILTSLRIFINNFENRFLNNISYKTKFVNSDTDNKKKLCRQLYLDDIYKKSIENLDDDSSQEDCLIDDL
jgi:hypothetical protein